MTDIRSTTAAKAVLAIGMMLLLADCGKKRTPQYVHIGPDSLPTKSYERGPEERFNLSDYVIKLKQMTSFYDVPGEAGYFMNGEDLWLQRALISPDGNPTGRRAAFAYARQ